MKDIERVVDSKNRRGAFEVATALRVYSLVAQSEKKKQEWMEAIVKAQVRPSRLAQLLSRLKSAAGAGLFTPEVIKAFLALHQMTETLARPAGAGSIGR